MFKRFASILMAIIMVIGVFPVSAMAEDETLKDRAYLQLGRFETVFQKGISGFGSDGIMGTHIRYIFSAKNENGTEMSMEEVLSYLEANTGSYPQNIGGGFVTNLEAPGEGYEVTGIKVDGEEEIVADYVGENGELDGLGWIKFIDNGNLCNASKIYSVTWNNGSETVTDNIMISLIFPQIPATAAERTSFVMPNVMQDMFDIGSNRAGDRLEYYWRNEESTEEEVKTALDELNGKVMVRIEAPNDTFSKVKSIGWNGTDHTADFIGENGNLEFSGDIMFFNYLDGNGKLQNYQRDFEIVWTDSTGTKEYVDEIRVILAFPQVEENQGGGEGGGNQGANKSESEVTGGTETPAVNEEMPDDFYDYWDPEDIIIKNQIKVTAPGRLGDYLECSYDEYGVITVKLKKDIPAEVWKEAYDQLEPNSTAIGADIEVYAPGNYNSVATTHGNGDIYKNLIRQYEDDPSKVIFHDFNPENDFVGCGYFNAQIINDEDKVTIIPNGTDGIYYSTLLWKNGDEVKRQILIFRYEVEEGAESVSFENIRRPAQNVIFDDRTEEENPVIKAEYDRNSGYLKYTYIGTETEDIKIAEDIMGTTGDNTLWTVIVAPEGYKNANNNSQIYDIGLSIDSPDSAIVGRTISEEVKWVNESGDEITEIITIEFDPGKTWMDIYFDPVSTDRIVYADRYGNYYSKEEFEAAGLFISDKNGYAYSSFANELDKIDIEMIANAGAILLPPDAVERTEGESTEDWVSRVYSNTRYKNYVYVHSSGPNGYDPDFADEQLNVIDERDIVSLEENGNAAELAVANFDKININEIDVWFGETLRRGYSNKVLVGWIDANNNMVNEYFYTEQEQFYFEDTEPAKETITEEVVNPTPIGKDWKLTTNHYPQVKENENVNAYYFQLEGDENTPDGKKVVYLPYSFIDEDLDYDKAVDMGLEPKIHHYKEDHKTYVEGKPIDGELTPYGIRFEVESFSPFVLEWEEETHEFGETVYEWSEDGKACTAKRVCTVCDDHTEKAEAKVEGKKVSDPTCTEKGKTEYTATFDVEWAENQKKTVLDIPETGHSFGGWKTVIEPTEEKDGTKVKTCSECGKQIIGNIPKNSGITIITPGEKTEDESNPNTGAAVTLL